MLTLLLLLLLLALLLFLLLQDMQAALKGVTSQLTAGFSWQTSLL
jgi:hypothetical protein